MIRFGAFWKHVSFTILRLAIGLTIAAKTPVKNHYTRERTTKENRKYTPKCSYEWQVLKEESSPCVELLKHI